ncbi:hypothetical protein COOONC_10325 [Cooperia oncophora]
MDDFEDGSLRSSEVVRNGEAVSINQSNGLDSATSTIETPREAVVRDHDENERAVVAHGEGPSVSSVCNGVVSSPSSNKSHGDNSLLKSPSCTKPKRDIYAIRSRKVGRVGTYSVSGVCFVCGKGGDLVNCGKKYTSTSFCTTKFHEKCIEVSSFSSFSFSSFPSRILFS